MIFREINPRWHCIWLLSRVGLSFVKRGMLINVKSFLDSWCTCVVSCLRTMWRMRHRTTLVRCIYKVASFVLISVVLSGRNYQSLRYTFVHTLLRTDTQFVLFHCYFGWIFRQTMLPCRCFYFLFELIKLLKTLILSWHTRSFLFSGRIFRSLILLKTC